MTLKEQALQAYRERQAEQAEGKRIEAERIERENAEWREKFKGQLMEKVHRILGYSPTDEDYVLNHGVGHVVVEGIELTSAGKETLQAVTRCPRCSREGTLRWVTGLADFGEVLLAMEDFPLCGSCESEERSAAMYAEEEEDQDEEEVSQVFAPPPSVEDRLVDALRSYILNVVYDETGEINTRLERIAAKNADRVADLNRTIDGLRDDINALERSR